MASRAADRVPIVRASRSLVAGIGAAVWGAMSGAALAAAPEVRTPTWKAYTPRWNPASVEPGERAVVVSVTQDSCGSRNLRVRVSQSAAAIVVHVSAEQAVYSGPGKISCPGPRSQPVTIELGRALDGRPFGGIGEAPGGGGVEYRMLDGRFVLGNRVPRLIGFSLRDARIAAASVDLPIEVSRRRGGEARRRVIAQSPRPGAFVEIPAGPSAPGPPVLLSLGTSTPGTARRA